MLRRRDTLRTVSGLPGSRAALGVAVLATATAAALRAGVTPEVLLWFTPALLLIAALCAGRFPGEAVIQAHRRTPTRAPRRRDARSVSTRRRAPRAAGRRGLLLAFRLAERGPPVAALAVDHGA
jgi:hypothetical protein